MRRRLIISWLLLACGLSTATFVYLPLPQVSVRWTGSVSDAERVVLEERFRLTRGQSREGQTWSYRLEDSGEENVGALVRDARVEDTHGIDRATLAVDGALTPGARLAAALALGAGLSTLVCVGVVRRRRLARFVAQTIAPAVLGETRAAWVIFLALSVSAAVLVKMPSWSEVSWDDEDLLMSIVTTMTHARYWSEGIWTPLWSNLQGFGIPHPSAAHLIYSPLFPLMLLLPHGTALSLHYSVMAAIGAWGLFALACRLGASPRMAALAAVTWLSSSSVTQLYFVDLWTLTFTFVNLVPALIVALLDCTNPDRRGVATSDTLRLGMVAGIALNCATPALSVPLAMPLVIVVIVQARRLSLARLGMVGLAFLAALAMYAPVLIQLWDEFQRLNGPRNYTMDVEYLPMLSSALWWPASNYLRAAGFGAPFAVVALLSMLVATSRRAEVPRTIAWRAMALAALVCLVLYVQRVYTFPLSSGNGTWGQLLTMFAVPVAAARLSSWHRDGGRGMRLLASVVVVAQLGLVASWALTWLRFQAAQAKAESVGRMLREPSELELALVEHVDSDRNRVLLSPRAEELLLRGVDGHVTSFVRQGVPVVNGWFKFVSYASVYPNLDTTWGAVLTAGEEITPEALDVTAISYLVTLDDETPEDISLTLVGTYQGHGPAAFSVWENVDVWPRVTFIEASATQTEDKEEGVVLWRRTVMPSRSLDPVTDELVRPGSHVVRFEPDPAARVLVIADMVRSDLMTVRGASLVSGVPLSDVFAVLRVPAGTDTVEVSWERPRRRWLWRLSYGAIVLMAVGYVASRRGERSRRADAGRSEPRARAASGV